MNIKAEVVEQALENMAKTIDLMHQAHKIEKRATQVNAILQTVDRLRRYLPREVSGRITNRAIAAQAVITQQLNDINQKLDEQIKRTKEVVKRVTEDTKKDAHTAAGSYTSKPEQDASSANENTTPHA